MEITDQKEQKQSFIWLVILSILGALVGYFVTKIFQYLQTILRQPRYISQAIFSTEQDTEALEIRAVNIAIQNLRAGIEPRFLPDSSQNLILRAGSRNFREPWARDFGFASFGLLALGEYRVVRETLEVFLLFQLPDGQFPVKIHSTSIATRYLHSLLNREQPITAPLKPKYMTAHRSVSLDGNALLVIAALNYAKETSDHSFLEEHWQQLKRAVLWLEDHASPEDGLLHQRPFADWADSIAREGRVLYTNIIYWKALDEFAQAAQEFEDQTDREIFEAKAQSIKAAINNLFWRPDLGYFVTNEVFDNLSSSGNLLCIAWDLTTPEQANSILDAMEEFGMADPVPTRTVHRPYPRRFIAIENRLGGIGYYHTDAAWLWLGSWHVIAAHHMGRTERAHELFSRMAEVIVRDGEVHEVYGPNGEYVSTFWYTSEAPLTWSAGMVVYACEFLKQ